MNNEHPVYQIFPCKNCLCEFKVAIGAEHEFGRRYCCQKCYDGSQEKERKVKAEQLIRQMESRREFFVDASGYVYFEPKECRGCSGIFSAYKLRIIADELDRRNLEWDSLLEKALKEG